MARLDSLEDWMPCILPLTPGIEGTLFTNLTFLRLGMDRLRARRINRNVRRKPSHGSWKILVSRLTKNSKKEVQNNRSKSQRYAKIWRDEVTPQNAWDPLIVSFDGGGVRGYASLLILQRIMERVVEFELEWSEGRKCHTDGEPLTSNSVLPCHYFDHMWGTSTGGLIAIMLGRLRMSVPQALEAYRTLGAQVFGEKRLGRFSWLTCGGIFAPKYYATNLETAVKTVVRKHCKESYGFGRDCDNDPLEFRNCLGAGKSHWRHWQCQAVCVTAWTKDNEGYASQEGPLPTYGNVELDSESKIPNSQPPVRLMIWEAARATSAAPFNFPSYKKEFEIEKRRPGHKRVKETTTYRFKDGGIESNNPSWQARLQIQSIPMYRAHPNTPEDKRRRPSDPKRPLEPALLLSIGTGCKRDSPFKKRGKSIIPGRAVLASRLRVLSHMRTRYTEGQKVHENLLSVAHGDCRWYKRLDPDASRGFGDDDYDENEKLVQLGKIKLGEWENGPWQGGPDQPGGKTLTKMETSIRQYLTRDWLERKNNLMDDHLLPSEIVNDIAWKLVKARIERRRLAESQPAEYRDRWHMHQGMCAYGTRNMNWTDDHFDGPYERPDVEEPQRKRTLTERISGSRSRSRSTRSRSTRSSQK